MKAKAGRAPGHAQRELPREVRIIGGLWKRTKLPVADRPGLRPTPDRVRETLFNWLGQDLTGWRCVDAFAGSGALGFEAASRGAGAVTLLERDPAAAAQLRATQQRLGASTVTVERVDALSWLARSAPAAVDLVFLDPPFEEPRLLPLAIVSAARIVRAGGFVYVESATPLAAGEDDGPLEPFRTGRAGSVHFHLLRRRAGDDGYTARDPDARSAT